MLTFVLPCN